MGSVVGGCAGASGGARRTACRCCAAAPDPAPPRCTVTPSLGGSGARPRPVNAQRSQRGAGAPGGGAALRRSAARQPGHLPNHSIAKPASRRTSGREGGWPPRRNSPETSGAPPTRHSARVSARHLASRHHHAHTHKTRGCPASSLACSPMKYSQRSIRPLAKSINAAFDDVSIFRPLRVSLDAANPRSQLLHRICKERETQAYAPYRLARRHARRHARDRDRQSLRHRHALYSHSAPRHAHRARARARARARRHCLKRERCVRRCDATT